MDGFGLIISRDMRELARTTAFRVIFIVLLLAATALAAGTAAMILAPPAGPEGPTAGPGAQSPVGTMLYFATLLPFLVLLWAFAGPLIIDEKASGHLETLLATPLSPRTIWLAKASVIVLPGLAMAAFSAALITWATAIALHLKASPETIALILPPPLLLACCLGNPLLFSGLGALVIILSMRASPDLAILPSFIIGFGLMAVVPVGAGLGFLKLSSWTFASGYLAVGILEWVIVLALERGLTKEKIVLSSRED